LRRIEEELRQNEALLLQSQHMAAIGHFVLDRETGFLKTSTEFDEIFSPGPHYPKTIPTWQAWVHPQHRNEFSTRITDFLKTGGQFEHQFPIIRSKDRAQRWVKMIAEMTLGEDGQPSSLFGNVQDITEFKNAEAEIQQLAYYDSLTRLPNRRLLLDRLSRAKALSTRNGHYGALIFIDIDNFKALNDTRGHRVGDMFLEEVAKRLVACVRLSDTVARFGGDEFVVMIESLNEMAEEVAIQADTVAEKILKQLTQPFLLESQIHYSGASLGITLFKGTDLSNDDLLKQADLAMYQAKAAGRNTVRFYDPRMQSALTAYTSMEHSLRRAVERDEFVLHYQPQVAADGKIVGAEGLIRWVHPERGLVMPGEFIAIAEGSDLILPIGLMVIETACRQLVAWNKIQATRDLSLAVNVSARQFHHLRFVEDVRRTLDNTGADPTKLKLELTESLLLQDINDCATKMAELRDLGLRLSLDDFGTGYSSLSYLKRLPFSQLKIDRSFVRDVLADPNDAIVARTIIILAKSFGLNVIAEGVEEEAQWRFLAAEGCDEAQGYLYSKPLPTDEFLKFVHEHVVLSK
jgi:diguanylate cyclase (GGDEF)-like protein/PAS domain S-box-containing protein